MSPDRADLILQFALLTAGREDDPCDRELGPIHLIKYVYLADLAYAERHSGQIYSGAPWKFHHYGPWAVDVYQRIEPALRAIGAEERAVASQYDRDLVRWSKVDDQLYERIERQLPGEVVSTIRRSVRQFGRDTSELLHHVYTTPPMLKAARNKALEFEARVYAPVRPEASLDALTKKQQKRRKARLVAAKSRVAARLAEKRAQRASQKLAPAPRYDEVFFEGLKWLNSLAGDPIEAAQGEVSFDDDVWESPTRSETRG